jgi:hypothetical protein
MPVITWELWLARDIVLDNPLPWQKSIEKLTPGRVAQAMGGDKREDWNTSLTSKTPWKITWLENWAATHT